MDKYLSGREGKMGIKRNVSRLRVKKRAFKRRSTQSKSRKLALARNKALKEAENYAKIAALSEEKRKAELKKENAKKKLNAGRKPAIDVKKSARTAKRLTSSTVKTIKRINKSMERWAAKSRTK